MLSKSTITYIRSLQEKTVRHQEKTFVVEWRKSMEEYFNSHFEIIQWFFTEEYSLDKPYDFPVDTLSAGELARITTLKTNDTGILLVKMRDHILPQIWTNELVLVLDAINDPGNLGTIIRIADWYGISHIIASPDTVDCYNSKVIMATMGSLSRVAVHYTELDNYLSSVTGIVYGAYLDGEDIHRMDFSYRGGHIVIGSEAHGINPKLKKYITNEITIPKFGQAESLNAGVAAAIIVDRIAGFRSCSQ